tara:strand:+ start:7284 stop:7856 length:573 start_codon:yes stop_codon:yes gene_type:complete
MKVTHTDQHMYRNKYCGPAAVSVIAGITAEAAAEKFREYRDANNTRGKARQSKTQHAGIVGVWNKEMIPVLKTLGVKTNLVKMNGYVRSSSGRKWVRSGPTLRAYADELKPNVTYLFNVTNHYVTVRNGMVYDNWHNEGKPISEHRAARKKFPKAWEVTPAKPAKPAQPLPPMPKPRPNKKSPTIQPSLF